MHPKPGMCSRRRNAAIWFAVFLVLAGLAAVGGIDHDEDQYFAVAQLARTMLPYRDFIDLQGPLFAWWGAAVLALAPGYGLLAARVTQAALGVCLLATVHAIVRRLGGGSREAVLAVVAMALCQTFAFTSTVFRNDMLPALIAALAMLVILGDARRGVASGAWAWLACGFLIATAASVKINHIVLALAPLGWLAAQRGQPLPQRLRLVLAYAAGGVAGAVPVLAALALWPDRFWWQTVTFAAQAPLLWFEQAGYGWRLTLAGRLLNIAGALAMGPALVALAAIVAGRRGCRRAGGDEGSNPFLPSQLALIDWFLLCALVAAAIPNPFYKQYLLVALPPLFVRLPFALRGRGSFPKWRAALLAFGLVGLVGSWLMPLATLALQPQQSLLASWRDSRWLGERLKAEGSAGTLATLSPHLAVDSGALPDSRFAAGVFVYRWNAPEQAAQIVAMGGVTAATLPTVFARHPPAAIVLRHQFQPSHGVDLERPLQAYAERNGYRRIAGPDGQAVLYLPGRQDPGGGAGRNSPAGL